tara:strand:- start:870 stop:1349 length:480 start_codon:yes stop_codon:yes gene_type:complete
MQIIDNLFTSEEVEKIYENYKNFPYKRTEVDAPGLPYTGLISNLNFQDQTVKSLIERTKIGKIELLNAYINLFLKEEKPYFHIDGQYGYKTLLYYMNPSYKNYDDLGETYLIIDNKIQGIRPIPGRVVIFDASILHRASSLRNEDRFTIALKFKKGDKQ